MDTKRELELTQEIENLRRQVGAYQARENEWRDIKKELEKSKEKFRLLTEKSVAGIYIIQDAKMAYVNPIFARTYGYDPQEIIGKLSPKDLIHPDDIQAVMQWLQERLEGAVESGNKSYRALKKDGSLINIEVYGVQIEYQGKPAVMGSLIDITERKHREQQYETFFTDNVSAIFWIEMENPIPIDLSVDQQVEAIFREGYIEDASDIVASALGLESEALIGARLPVVYGPESILPGGNVYNIYEAFVHSGYKLLQYEAPETSQSGAVNWF